MHNQSILPGWNCTYTPSTWRNESILCPIKNINMKSKIIIPIVFAICIASGSIVFYKKANHKTNPIEYADGILHFLKIHNAKRSWDPSSWFHPHASSCSYAYVHVRIPGEKMTGKQWKRHFPAQGCSRIYWWDVHSSARRMMTSSWGLSIPTP